MITEGLNVSVNMSAGARARNFSFVVLDPYGIIVSTSNDSIVAMTEDHNVSMIEYYNDDQDSEVEIFSWIKKVRSKMGVVNFSTIPMDMSAPHTSLRKSI